jgi:apolipoprotein N-acyltransferase
MQTAATGWWFGFGYFVVGVYWVGHAFLVDAEIFAWLLPFPLVAMPSILAVSTAIGVCLARLLWTRGPARILALAIGLTVGEWLRGHSFTGFPWDSLGYALTGSLALAQSAALVGIWGLTFITVAVFATPATLFDDRADTRWPWLPSLIAVAVLAALAAFGTLRLSHTATTFVDGVRLRIMQPNLQQDQKFNYSAKAKVMSQYIDLSSRPTEMRPAGLRDVTHLIWPESAFPFYLAREPDVLAQIAALLSGRTVLITGADRTEERPGGGEATYNSIYVIDRDGAVTGRYDKVHLVPFGEYLPFQSLLERLGIMQLTKVEGGYAWGEGRELLKVPGAPSTSPLLCYEVIFAGEVVPRGERPGWILNLTNDGWFGISTGPYQHLRQARVRAIEEGLPLVRAANSGISAIVDPLGRVVRSLPLGVEGVLDAPLPQAIAPTLYARFGDGPAAALVVVALVVVVGWRFKTKR